MLSTTLSKASLGSTASKRCVSPSSWTSTSTFRQNCSIRRPIRHSSTNSIGSISSAQHLNLPPNMASRPANGFPISRSERPTSLYSSARPEFKPLNGFHRLVDDINRILGPWAGINSEGVNIADLQQVMHQYTSVEAEWQKYAFSDNNMAYTRNLVDSGNGKSNLLILVWTPGKSSPVHDHANSHCMMKILKGSLRETTYDWPCQSASNVVDCATAKRSSHPSTKHTCSGGDNLEPNALRIQRAVVYETEQVAYMSDQIGLHRVENPSKDEVAVSLHLYTPPNAAKHGTHIFNPATGKRVHVPKCHFYSEYGVRKQATIS